MKKTFAFLLTALLLVIACALLWLGRTSRDSSDQETASPTVGTKDYGAAPAPAVNSNPLTSTPADTVPVSRFAVDAGGQLQITPDLRRIFDYFLGAADNAPSDANIARARSHIREQLKEPASSEALAVFNSYVDYRRALGERQKGNPGNPALGDNDLAAIAAMQQLATLKARYLPANVIQAFYGDDDAIAYYLLARKQVQQMNGLSQQQKDDQLAALWQELPISAQKTMKDSMAASGRP